MQNILVTGSSGFIGYNFVSYLHKKYKGDINIVCLDRVYRPMPEGCFFFRVDLSNLTDSLCGNLAQFKLDQIIHFAAETHVDKSIEQPDKFIRSNILGTYNLLEFARELNIPFHYVSTDEVYGCTSIFAHEDIKFNPSSPYAATKAAGEHLVMSYYKTYGLHVTINRCSNNFGPFQGLDKFIPVVISHCLSGKPIPIYGDGQQARDWLYVLDHCQAIEMIVKKATKGSIFNVGTQILRTNNSIAKKIGSILKKKGKIKDFKIEHVKDRPGHDKAYRIDCAKVKSELGWAPKAAFDVALETTIEWYCETYERLYQACRRNTSTVKEGAK